ncbi:unnamed protein product [Linum trigynum]|uniref:Uncharacterized protein n=1 Tax=Linum trigynum TaxID=586398 RepID=A0AAV2GMX1_9ROSI
MAENQTATNTQAAANEQPSIDQPPPVTYQMEDPYFFHGSKQLESTLVAERLNTTNYDDKSRAMFNQNHKRQIQSMEFG